MCKIQDYKTFYAADRRAKRVIKHSEVGKTEDRSNNFQFGHLLSNIKCNVMSGNQVHDCKYRARNQQEQIPEKNRRLFLPDRQRNIKGADLKRNHVNRGHIQPEGPQDHQKRMDPVSAVVRV